jgi:hypothetical protein
MQKATNERSELARTERQPDNHSSRKHGLAHATTLHPAQQQRLKNNAAALPESDTPPKSSFNMEDLREQARTLARGPTDQLVRNAKTNRQAS